LQIQHNPWCSNNIQEKKKYIYLQLFLCYELGIGFHNLNDKIIAADVTPPTLRRVFVSTFIKGLETTKRFIGIGQLGHSAIVLNFH